MDVRHGGHLRARATAHSPTILRPPFPPYDSDKIGAHHSLPGRAFPMALEQQRQRHKPSTRAHGLAGSRASTTSALKLHHTHQVAQNSTTVTFPPPSFTGDPCTRRPANTISRSP